MCETFWMKLLGKPLWETNSHGPEACDHRPPQDYKNPVQPIRPRKEEPVSSGGDRGAGHWCSNYKATHDESSIAGSVSWIISIWFGIIWSGDFLCSWSKVKAKTHCSKQRLQSLRFTRDTPVLRTRCPIHQPATCWMMWCITCGPCSFFFGAGLCCKRGDLGWWPKSIEELSRRAGTGCCSDPCLSCLSLSYETLGSICIDVREDQFDHMRLGFNSLGHELGELLYLF